MPFPSPACSKPFRLAASGLLLMGVLLVDQVRADYSFVTLAGTPGRSGGADGAGPDVRFGHSGNNVAVAGVGVDAAGNLTIADRWNHAIRRVAPTGVSSTIAGLAAGLYYGQGDQDGLRDEARFHFPSGVAVDNAGNVFVADTYNGAIRQITATGVVTTLVEGLHGPEGVAVDQSGNIYVADTQYNSIRKVTPEGVVTLLAGGDGEFAYGGEDGIGTAARFRRPEALAVDSAGNVYVADTGNSTIRKISPSGLVETLAGIALQNGYADGTGSSARFSFPRGIAVDVNGHVFVADTGNNVIRKITPAGVVSSVAGVVGQPAVTDGTGAGIRFHYPVGLAVDGTGVLYVMDSDSYTMVLRKGYPDVATAATIQRQPENVTVLEGARTEFKASATGVPATFSYSWERSVDAGVSWNVLVEGGPYEGTATGLLRITAASLTMDHDLYRCVVSNGVGVPAASNPAQMRVVEAPAALVFSTLETPYIFQSNQNHLDGPAALARFRPAGITRASDGTLYVADYLNHCIRRIDPTGQVSTLAGLANVSGSMDGTGAAARFAYPAAITLDAEGNLFVVDQAHASNSLVRKITAAGVVTTLAGGFSNPKGITAGPDGYVYLADTGNSVIRRISSGGAVSIWAGGLQEPGSADGSGGAARFNLPQGIAADASGNLYVGDTGNSTIRKIAPGGAVTTLAGLAGSTGTADGQGTAARFGIAGLDGFGLSGLAVDAAGNVFVTDSSNRTIRKVTAAGAVTTIGGQPGVAGRVDGVRGAATYFMPRSLTLDATGTLYVVDDLRLRRLQPDGRTETVAGQAGGIYQPRGIAVDAEGGILVANFSSGYGGVVRFTPAGMCQVVFDGEFRSSVAVDRNGMTYVGSTNSSGLIMIHPNGWAIPLETSSLQRSHALAVGEDLTLYAANTFDAYISRIGDRGDVTKYTGASFSEARSVAVDDRGNIYVADAGNHTIGRINPDGTLTMLAGSPGVPGSADGVGDTARFNAPRGIAVDPAGNVIVADTGNYTLRQITPEGAVTTLAGLAGSIGTASGTPQQTRFVLPVAVAVDAYGNIFVVDEGSSTVRVAARAPVVLTPPQGGTVVAGREATLSVVAHSALPLTYQWRKNGQAISGATGAVLVLSDLAEDDAGNYDVIVGNPTGSTVSGQAILAVVELPGQTIFFNPLAKIALAPTPVPLDASSTSGLPVTLTLLSGPAELSGNTLTLTGTGEVVMRASQGGDANFAPAPDVDRVILVTTDSHYTPPYVFTTRAGAGQIGGWADGTGSTARFFLPSQVVVDATGTVYVADTGNQVIRKISSHGVVSTLAGFAGESGNTDGTGSEARFWAPKGLAVDSVGNVYVADQNNHTIRKITPDGMVTTLAGMAGQSGFADGSGSAARFSNPEGLTVDATDQLYVADFNNHAIRRVTSAGVVTTLVGAPDNAGSDDGAVAIAQFSGPSGVTADGSGNLYVSDFNNNTVRKITAEGMVSTLAGAAGESGSADGVGSAARFSGPWAVAVDDSGQVFVTELSAHTVRRITPDGTVTTLAGSSGHYGWADGTGANVRFRMPQGIAVDQAGNLYVADFFTATVRWGALGVPVFAPDVSLTGNPGQNFFYQVEANGTFGPFDAAGLPAGLALDPHTGALSGVPTEPGEFVVTLTALNGAGIGTGQLSVSIVETYASWVQVNFTGPELADSGISGPNADPDGDGYSNLVEYALGVGPKTPGSGGLSEVSTTSTDWVYTYERPSDRTDLTYTVEVSLDLASWSTSGVTHEWVSTDGDIETWRASYAIALASNIFFRLRITQE